MKITDVELPQYSKAQELWNSISHGLGTVFTLIAGPFLLVKASKTHDWLTILSCSVFILTLLLLYTISCIYHALGRNNGKRVLRILDHDMVFVLIMGTYAPYTLVGLHEVPGSSFPWGYVIFGIVWAGCIFGIVMNSIDIKKYKLLSMCIYVLIGSAILVAFIPLWQTIGAAGTLLLLGGGVAYWVGAILYNIGGRKNAWLHTVFHFFVLAGTILMFFSIYFYVIP